MKSVQTSARVFLIVCLVAGTFGTAYASDADVAHTDTSHLSDKTANAHINNNRARPPESAKENLERLILSEDYSKIQETSKWVKKEEAYEPEEIRDSSPWLEGLYDFLDKISQWSGEVGVVLKILALALLALIVYFLVKHRHALSSALSRIIKKDRPAVKSFLALPRADISDNLPDKERFAKAVQQLIDEGQYLMALSLLYRGTLRELSLAHNLPITHSQTEAQCQLLLATARRHFGGEVVFFDNLVEIWQEAAYGKRLPTEPKIRLTKLNQDWQALYHHHDKNNKREVV